MVTEAHSKARRKHASAATGSRKPRHGGATADQPPILRPFPRVIDMLTQDYKAAKAIVKAGAVVPLVHLVKVR